MRLASCRPARRAPRAVAVLACLAAVAPALGAQPAVDSLPFEPGERLTYEVRTSRFGGVGRSTMWVEGPADVRGREAWVLRFDFSARVGPVKAEDRTTSWYDAGRGLSLRFLKRERHPLSRHDEEIELYPGARRWEAKDGSEGESPTDAPLDELSFMYFLRTLPFATGTDWRFARHYAADRNPVTVRLLGRDVVEVPAGRFRVVQLEMRVRDPRRYRGEGTIRIDLTDDACRLPVRIESRLPVVGAAVMTLASHNAGGCAAEDTTRVAGG